jgi:Zn-dependent peptidase ImmA (M78 family)
MTPDYNKAQSAAENIISDYKITDPVVPIYDVAESKGLSVRTIDMPDELKGVSGFLDPDEKVIYVSADDIPTRQLFTVAHELGHYVLEHDPETYGVLLRFPELNGGEPVEQEANCFAANLLVPRHMLKEVMRKHSLSKDDIGLLAPLFGVSTTVMRYRLERI